MKLINIILIASIMMLVLPSNAAYGPITMRHGANISLDSGNITDVNGVLNLSANHLALGPVNYPTSAYPADSNAYFTIDKSNTASDASIVLRDQGAAKAEIGIITNNDIHFKTVTGAYGAETFTDKFIINNTYYGIDAHNSPWLRNYNTTGSPAIIAGNSNLTTGAGLEMVYNQVAKAGSINAVEWGNQYRPLTVSAEHFVVRTGTSSVTEALNVTSSGDILIDKNITLDGGYVLGAANATTDQGLMTLSQKGYTSIWDYGIYGDGITDVTDEMQALFNLRGKIYIPSGIYRIDATRGLSIWNDTTVIMEVDTVIKNLPYNLSGYHIFNLAESHNVRIVGGILDGNRAENTNVTGESGHGINIVSSENITIEGVVSRNNWGDGICVATKDLGVTHNKNLNINANCYGNRRQGLTFDDGIGCVIRGRYTDTSGTAPEAGIDFEPYQNEVICGVVVDNVYTGNNNGGGIIVVVSDHFQEEYPFDLKIVNHVDDGSSNGFYAISWLVTYPGSIIIDNPTWKNSKYCGFYVRNWGRYSPKIVVNNPIVINPIREEFTTTPYDSAYLVYVRVAIGGTLPSGNVHIFYPTLINTQGLAPGHFAYFYDERGSYLSSCTLYDALATNASSTDLTVTGGTIRFVDDYSLLT